MSLIKEIFRLEVLRRLVCWLGSLYIRFVFLTSKWDSVRREIPQTFWKENNPFILCFWHGRLLMMPYCWNHKVTINLLTSQHRDGQLISKTVSHFGFYSITGSSSKGGARALRRIIKKLLGGECVGLTPDGPRGPRMRVGEGVITIARLSGAPIIPIAFSIDNGRILNTWDRFLIALPFGRGLFVWGKPIYVSRNADQYLQEKARQEVEDRLLEITNEADIALDRKIIQPSSEPHQNSVR